MAMMTQLWSSISRRMTSATTRSITSSSSSISVSKSTAVVCGRGDKKTKRGKRFKGSYGNARPKKKEMIERIKDKLEVPRSTPWPLPFKLI